jgi:ATP-binding cassette subfamily B protein
MNETKGQRQFPERNSRPQRGPGHGPPMFRGEKPKNFGAGMKKLLQFLAPFKFHILLVTICSASTTVLSLVVPKLLAKVTNEIARAALERAGGGEGGFNFTLINSVLLLMLGIYICSMLISFVQGFTMSGVTTRVSYDLRNRLMAKINRLPVSFFGKMTNGEVLSRITNDVDTMSQSLTQSVTQSITTILTLLVALGMMLSISWKMTVIALFMIPGSALCTLFMVKVSQKYFRAQQKLLGNVNGTVEEMFGGHMVIKAFSAEKRVMKEFEEQNDALYTTAWKAQFLTGMMMPLMNLVGNLGYVAVCMMGAYYTMHGSMEVGDVLAFISYIRSFTQPISQLANISSQLQSTVAASERVFEFLDSPDEVDGDVKYSTAANPIDGAVRFEHVSFAYEPKPERPALPFAIPPEMLKNMPKDAFPFPMPPAQEETHSKAGEPVIRDFSASVKAGQKTAIVGPTGAGKTTIVKLLMRFYDIQEGAIYVDGMNIANFARRDLRSKFGMVLQDTWLFAGTIMENIRYGRPDATDEEVIEAAKAAQVDHFVRTLPDGYDLEINEETTNISQGQKQLITIARAILADSKILILDEATSSVDTRTEILIQRAMDNLMQGRTSFIIAHRLSTIKNADLILCVSDGNIVEQGSHEELMAKGGFYADLYNSQFEH